MSRPQFITPEQITQWDENINNDSLLKGVVPQAFIGDAVMREVLYASLWLQEEMIKLGAVDTTIYASQLTLGKESFGADPWQVAQTLLDLYITNKGKN